MANKGPIVDTLKSLDKLRKQRQRQGFKKTIKNAYKVGFLSNLYGNEEALIGVVVASQETTTIIESNQQADEIFAAPKGHLYGKSLSWLVKQIVDCSVKESVESQLIDFLAKASRASNNFSNPKGFAHNPYYQATTRTLFGKNEENRYQERFIQIHDYKNNTIRISIFCITDPVEKIIGLFFTQDACNEDQSRSCENILQLESLRAALVEKINARNLDHRLNSVYKSLVKKWKQVGIGFGSVLLLGTGVFSLFVGGLVGNKFGEQSTEYYDHLLKKAEQKAEDEKKEKYEQPKPKQPIRSRAGSN